MAQVVALFKKNVPYLFWRFGKSRTIRFGPLRGDGAPFEARFA
jgi:hypothetical protein